MDPLSLMGLAIAYGGAAVAQKAAEKSVEDSWNLIKSYLGGIFGGQHEVIEVSRQALSTMGADHNVKVLEEARKIFGSTPALRRAELVAPILRFAQILWVDDNPQNNIYEREVLQILGSNVDVATSSEEGLLALQSKVYDLVVSDMSRDNNPKEGLTMLEEMRNSRFPQQVIFYVGHVDSKKGTPEGSFGITRRPDELLHLIMDILERTRV